MNEKKHERTTLGLAFIELGYLLYGYDFSWARLVPRLKISMI